MCRCRQFSRTIFLTSDLEIYRIILDTAHDSKAPGLKQASRAIILLENVHCTQAVDLKSSKRIAHCRVQHLSAQALPHRDLSQIPSGSLITRSSARFRPRSRFIH